MTTLQTTSDGKYKLGDHVFWGPRSDGQEYRITWIGYGPSGEMLKGLSTKPTSRCKGVDYYREFSQVVTLWDRYN